MVDEVKVRYTLDDNASAKLSNIQKGFGGLVTQGTLVVGALTGIGLGLGKMIDAAEESRRVMAQTESVIASTGGAAGVSAKSVADMANSLSRMTNFDDEAIQSGENLLLTFTKIGKDVFPEATKTMLDMSAALGQDLKGSAIQLGKALNDPIQGVTALRRVGVSFNDQQLQQIKTLQESGNLLGAQKIILSELKKEFGGSAVAVADFKTIFKNMVGNVVESIGTSLLPAVDGVLKQILSLGGAMGSMSGVDVLSRGMAFLGLMVIQTTSGFAYMIETIMKLGVLGVGVFNSLKIGVVGIADVIKAVPHGIDEIKNAIVNTQREALKNDKSVSDGMLAIANSRVNRLGEYEKSHAELLAMIRGQNVAGNKKAADTRVNDEKNANDSIVLASDEMFRLIMDSHNASVRKMRLQNKYTYAAEIKLLQELLESHKLTLQQKNKVQKEIDEVMLEEQKDISKQLLDDTISRLDKAKSYGDLYYAWQIQKNMAVLENEKLTTEDRITLTRRLNDEKMKAYQSFSADYLASVTDVANKDLSIQEKLAKGSLNFIKQVALKALDTKAAEAGAHIIAEGLKYALPTFGGSIAIAAGQLALLVGAVAAAHSAVDAIKFADGGIVMPTPGGTKAIIGEAGKAEAVIPLGTPEAREMLGGGDGTTKVIILSPDGITSLAKGIMKEQKRLIRTGQLSGATA
jgi:hypothetical protein